MLIMIVKYDHQAFVERLYLLISQSSLFALHVSDYRALIIKTKHLNINLLTHIIVSDTVTTDIYMHFM